MNEEAFREKLGEIMHVINPGVPFSKPKEGVPLKSIEEDKSLEGFLDYLRVSAKYIVFDLEATRRENQYLRRLLEQYDRDDG
jgi:hypothetical protein